MINTMKNIFVLSITVLLLAGCHSDTIYKKYKKFDNVSWSMNDTATFEFQVNKKEELGLYFAFRHHTDFPFSYINIGVTIYTPDGEIRSRNYHYRLKDTKLDWVGDGMGELWDIDFPIRKKMMFNKDGMCTIKITNKMHRPEIPGIMEVGLVVKKISKEKK